MALNLSKGDGINLSKEFDGLKNVELGLGWQAFVTKEVTRGGFFGFGGTTETIRESKDVDLDASCIAYDENKREVDAVWFQKLRAFKDSIIHTGDDLTGNDNKTGSDVPDNEIIKLSLNKIPQHVKQLVFIVNSYSGERFTEVDITWAQVRNADTDESLVRFDLSDKVNNTGMIMAKLYRDSHGDWNYKALGIPVNGKTYHDNHRDLKAVL